jgi:hypothetical protein
MRLFKYSCALLADFAGRGGLPIIHPHTRVHGPHEIKFDKAGPRALWDLWCDWMEEAEHHKHHQDGDHYVEGDLFKGGPSLFF